MVDWLLKFFDDPPPLTFNFLDLSASFNFYGLSIESSNIG